MKDRIAAHPGRVRLTPVAGQENVYDMERADSPSQPGTPLNKETMLDDDLVAFFNDYIEADDNLTLAGAIRIIEQQLFAQCQEITTSQSITVSDILEGGNLSIIAVGGGGGGTAHIGGGSGWVKFKKSVPLHAGDVLNIVIGAGGQGRLYGDAQVATAGGTTTVSKNGTLLLSAQGGGISPNDKRGADGAAGSGGFGSTSSDTSSDRRGGDGGQFGGGGAGASYYGTSRHRGGNGGRFGGGGGGNGVADSYLQEGESKPQNGGTGGQYGGNGGGGGARGTYDSHPNYTGQAGTKGTDVTDFYMPWGYPKAILGTSSPTFTSLTPSSLAQYLSIGDTYAHDSTSGAGSAGAGDSYKKSDGASGSNNSAPGGGGGGGGYGSKGGNGAQGWCNNSSVYPGCGGGGGGFFGDGGNAIRGEYSSSSPYNRAGAGGSGGGFFGNAGTSSQVYGSGGAGGFFAAGGAGGGSASTSMGGTGAGGGATSAMASDATTTTNGKGGDGIVLLFFTKRTRLVEIPEDL